ncbi:hypothetical protein HanHA89_Chr11g0410151 [Helianthus annuus]|nr:hypothetical protein HanHA89_Chr11g0410151 [Helianthus annuus]
MMTGQLWSDDCDHICQQICSSLVESCIASTLHFHLLSWLTNIVVEVRGIACSYEFSMFF